MQGASLIAACMQEASLDRAHMQATHLMLAHLQGASLEGAHLQGARIDEAFLQGALLTEAHMQGASLDAAFLQGVQSQGSTSFLFFFAQRMEELVGQETDLSGVIFEGGLSQKDVDSFVEDLPDDRAKELREKLTPHIGQPKSNKLPKNSGAITGSYTKEDAEKWIAKYKKATSEVPEDDS